MRRSNKRKAIDSERAMTIEMSHCDLGGLHTNHVTSPVNDITDQALVDNKEKLRTGYPGPSEWIMKREAYT